jgi:hypothetical protein
MSNYYQEEYYRLKREERYGKPKHGPIQEAFFVILGGLTVLTGITIATAIIVIIT